MPYTITCPTCHNPLTVEESPVPFVVACPTCHRPLTVPAVAIPVEPKPVPSEPSPDTPRHKPPARQPSTWRRFWPLLVLVALVGGIVWFVRAEQERADYQRFRQLGEERRLLIRTGGSEDRIQKIEAEM